MSEKITHFKLYSKLEAAPIGEVIGLIVTWEKDEKIFGQYYLSDQSTLSNPFSEAYWIKSDDKDFIDIPTDLHKKMLFKYRQKILYPVQTQYYQTASKDSFCPYEEDRFKWSEYDSSNLFTLASYNPDFFEAIKKHTTCQELKEKIRKTIELKDSLIHSLEVE